MTQPFAFMLQGGLDLVTPRIAAKPGSIFAGVNHEPAERGYRRTGGYERYDGRAQPHLAEFYYATFTDGSAAITAGAAITGGTSGATALALTDAVITSGTTGGGDAAGYLPLVALAGAAFEAGEDLEIAATPVATLTAVPVLNGGGTDAEAKAWRLAEMERRRALIQAPTGSGPIRGVWTYAGEVYAFRDNAGATAGGMWKATASGWAAVSFGEIVEFTTGTAEIVDGETLTQGGVTATVQRVVHQTGTWSGSDAAGYIVISGRSGGNYAAGVATTAGGSATLAGAQAAITLPAGGLYRFTNHNFGGVGYGERMYFVNGVGHAHEFDGTAIVPIKAPLSASVDKPQYVAQFAEHLWLVYAGGSILHSELGNPREFAVLEDAGEHNLGADCTGVIANAQSSLLFIGRNRTAYIVGTDNDNWEFRLLSSDSGGLENSIVMMLRPWWIDDRGIRDLAAAEALGDWRMGQASEIIAPYFDAKAAQGVKPAAAIRCRTRNQYRVYFDDGTGLVGYIGRKYPEFLPFELPVTAYCAVSGEDAASREVVFVGGTDGMVYLMDVGPGFDGEEVFAWLRLHFVAPQGSHMEYQWFQCEMEIDGSADNTIYASSEFDYGSPDSAAGTEEAFTISGGGGFYDSASWDEFVWDAPVQGVATVDLDGYGFNCSLAIVSQATTEDPYTLSSVRFFTSPRRQKR